MGFLRVANDSPNLLGNDYNGAYDVNSNGNAYHDSYVVYSSYGHFPDLDHDYRGLSIYVSGIIGNFYNVRSDSCGQYFIQIKSRF